MELVWSTSPITAAEIIERLGAPMNWKHQTVRTLLARLVKKGALSSEADGNRYLYRPLFTRDECVGVESESFLKRMFGGATQPLLVHFASRGELTKEELNELKRILNRKDPK